MVAWRADRPGLFWGGPRPALFVVMQSGSSRPGSTARHMPPTRIAAAARPSWFGWGWLGYVPPASQARSSERLWKAAARSAWPA